jgi:hypothetical protein
MRCEGKGTGVVERRGQVIGKGLTPELTELKPLINMPEKAAEQPMAEFLEWHNRNVFVA